MKNEKTRTIIIAVETDSNDSIEELKKDLATEIGCCSAFFYVDTMTIQEKKST